MACLLGYKMSARASIEIRRIYSVVGVITTSRLLSAEIN